MNVKYSKILLKLSGEALTSKNSTGINIDYAIPIVDEIIKVLNLGVKIAIVVGGGNFLRGGRSSFKGYINRATADQMGMLATIINALSLRDIFLEKGIKAEALSSKSIDGVIDGAGSHLAKKLLKDGNIVIFAGGTGNPFVTTDSASSLRAVEIEADALIKATTVDGVYDKDPNKFKDAKKFDYLSFDEALKKELKVMDLGSFLQCKEFDIPICVFNLHKKNALVDTVLGKNIGTIVKNNI